MSISIPVMAIRALTAAAVDALDAADPRDLEIATLRQEVVDLRARLARAEELADADVLTPVLNRRAFLRELKRAIASIDRYGGSGALLFFDLDDFKIVNDRHGHAAGDAVLTAVAERLTGQVRQSDIVGRLGGDEFAVLLTHASGAAATAKALGLTGAIAADPVRFGEAEIFVRASCGIREILGACSAEQVLAEADADMFLRKPPKPGED
jgi:diguanylate cyclase (GGDEF)-like protein